MSTRLLYRTAAIVLLVFCVMHTAGGMLSHQSHGLAADAVFEGMHRASFDVFGSRCTFFGFYFGFGLTCSVFQLLTAGMCWFLGGLPSDVLRRVAPLAWMLTASLAGLAVLSWVYFFPPPGIFASAATLLTGWAALRARSMPEPALAAQA